MVFIIIHKCVPQSYLDRRLTHTRVGSIYVIPVPLTYITCYMPSKMTAPCSGLESGPILEKGVIYSKINIHNV